jgi:hypothetical protein
MKAWLGLLLVIFTGGIVIIAPDLGLNPYRAALDAALIGMAVERLRRPVQEAGRSSAPALPGIGQPAAAAPLPR